MIVVGVDGSEPSLEALRWAIEEAGLRRATLRAMYAWQMPHAAGYGYAPPEVLDRERLERLAGEALDGWMTYVAGESAGVQVERDAVEGPATRVLVKAAEDAELLVVGSRGHGGFTGLLLGSVSQQCAHHAPRPVVIIRERRHAVEAG